MSSPDPSVAGALADDGYVLLPYRGNGDPGDPVAGFDAAGSVSIVVLVDGDQGDVDVLVEGSTDGDTWSTIHDFSGLTHAGSPAVYLASGPPAHLRATLTGSVKHLEVRAFPHAGSSGGGSMPLGYALNASLLTVFPLGETFSNAPWGIAFSPDGTKIYMSNNGGVGSTYIAVIDRASGIVTSLIPMILGAGAAWIVVAPDGTVYVAELDNPSYLAIIRDDALVTEIAIPTSCNCIALADDGAVYAPGQGEGDNYAVAVIQDDAVTSTIPGSTGGASGIAIAPNGDLYVSYNHAGAGLVDVIRDGAVAETITGVGTFPFGIAFTSDGTCYVNGGDGTVYVIQDEAVAATIDLSALVESSYALGVGPDDTVYVPSGSGPPLAVVLIQGLAVIGYVLAPHGSSDGYQIGADPQGVLWSPSTEIMGSGAGAFGIVKTPYYKPS